MCFSSQYCFKITILHLASFFPCFQTEAVRALNDASVRTVQLMVETEKRHVDKLRQDYASTNSILKQIELDQAIKRLARVEEQLTSLKEGKVGRAGLRLNEL